ncbi:MAG: hypothetical protein NTW30_05350, partial [Candidatus Aenigmarchaeota archaeon]|nr:hypothetical protein [Candidatus Aenigmarchaeota archaeon]
PYDTSWAWVWSNAIPHGSPDPHDIFCCNDNGCTAYKCNTGTYRCKFSCSSPSDCKSGYTCVSSACVPASCSGPISLSLVPNPGYTTQFTSVTITGLSGCSKDKTVYVKKDSCSGTAVCSIPVYGSMVYSSFQNPSLAGTYGYYACIDSLNSNRVDLTVNICKRLGESCPLKTECCVDSYCSGGVCKRVGGCPTLFVYDGKDYVKERKTNIHSQPGIDTVDDIILETEPVIVDGNYLLQLKETTLPEHSYIDSVKLFVTDSEGKKEAELVSAKHSKYGDVTDKLAKSDDIRTDTQVFDNIELKFAVPKLKGKANFIFEIEGYNPAVNILDKGVSIIGQVIMSGNMNRLKMDIADFNINKLPIIFACIVVTIVSMLVIFTVFKAAMRSDNTLLNA